VVVDKMNKTVTAKDVPMYDWFFLRSKKKWYKKVEEDENYVYGTQIGILSNFRVPLDAEVLIQKKS
jgi:hypothetical protein